MWTMILSFVGPFFKRNWKTLTLVLVVGGLLLWGGLWLRGLYSTIDKQEETIKKKNIQISDLEVKVSNRDIKIKNQEEIIEVQKKSIEVFGTIQESEKKAENHYHQKIIENKTVIKEYVDSKQDKESKRKHYEFLNKKWKSVGK